MQRTEFWNTDSLARMQNMHKELLNRPVVDEIPEFSVPGKPISARFINDEQRVIKVAALSPYPEQVKSPRTRLIGVLFSEHALVVETSMPLRKNPQTQVYIVDPSSGNTESLITGENALLQGRNTIGDQDRTRLWALASLNETMKSFPTVDTYEWAIGRLSLQNHRFTTELLNL